MLGDALRHIGQGAGNHPLVDRGALLHQRDRGIGTTAVAHQLFADHRQADQSHVEHQGLPRRDQIPPGQIAAAILEVTGDEAHRLGMVTVGQRNTRIGGTTGGGGNARHHLEGNALGGQLLDLLAAPTEDKRVAALQAQHALTLLGQLHQAPIDLFLGQRMLGALLADVDALGISAAQFDDCRRHQAVVEHHIGLLHQAQGTEGQQVRIAGTCADQIHLTQRPGRTARQLLLQQTLGLGRLAGEQALGDLALEGFFPEHPTLLHIRQRRLDPRTEFLGQPGQLPVGGGNPGLDAGADQARQHRRVATAGHRHHQRRAIDDGRKDHRAQFRCIHHVDRDAPRLGFTGNPGIERFVVGGGDCQTNPIQILLSVITQMQLAAMAGHQSRQLIQRFVGDHPRHRAGIGQQANLA